MKNIGKIFYSFNADIQASQIKIETEEDNYSQSSSGPPLSIPKEPKKRGRPKKIKDEK